MSWLLFLDESGQDRKFSPYEVLAGIAVEDRQIWPLIRQLNDAQKHHFGMRLFRAYGEEAKAKKLLKAKSFRLAAGADRIPVAERRDLVAGLLRRNGDAPTRRELAALGQSKIEYCRHALRLCKSYGCVAFASIIPNHLKRPERTHLRKDYSFLFERYFHFLNAKTPDEMGLVVFDELEKTQSHILVHQMENYFICTANGRTRSRLIIPEPLFVHSDLTTMIQMADILAYVISWGVRLSGMTEPDRPELREIARHAMALRYHAPTASYDVWGFKLISNLEVRPPVGA